MIPCVTKLNTQYLDVKMQEDGKDVGLSKDFLFFLKNIVAVEDHALSSYSQTKDKEQLELAMMSRRLRSKWEYRLIKKSKNQIYCETKHLSGVAMALVEVGNRFIETGEIKLAEECFEDSANMEAIVIHINDYFKNIDKDKCDCEKKSLFNKLKKQEVQNGSTEQPTKTN